MKSTITRIKATNKSVRQLMARYVMVLMVINWFFKISQKIYQHIILLITYLIGFYEVVLPIKLKLPVLIKAKHVTPKIAFYFSADEKHERKFFRQRYYPLKILYIVLKYQKYETV